MELGKHQKPTFSSLPMETESEDEVEPSFPDCGTKDLGQLLYPILGSPQETRIKHFMLRGSKVAISVFSVF